MGGKKVEGSFSQPAISETKGLNEKDLPGFDRNLKRMAKSLRNR